jgi:hypothetical protein
LCSNRYIEDLEIQILRNIILIVLDHQVPGVTHHVNPLLGPARVKVDFSDQHHRLYQQRAFIVIAADCLDHLDDLVAKEEHLVEKVPCVLGKLDPAVHIALGKVLFGDQERLVRIDLLAVSIHSLETLKLLHIVLVHLLNSKQQSAEENRLGVLLVSIAKSIK